MKGVTAFFIINKGNKKMFKTTAALAALANFASANSTPIYGTYPGYTVGEGRTGISIELFFDYLCSACQSENPVIEDLLQ